MKIIRYPQKSPLSKPSAVTIGNFDGVHKGHQALIKHTMSAAEAQSLQSVVVTMEPLPLQYFKGRFQVDLITPFKQKARLIQQLGVDMLCVLNFNRHLAQRSADEFCDEILDQGLHTSHIVVGHDFKFGADREGDVAYLSAWCRRKNIDIEVIPPIQNQHGRISSTCIRGLLKAGEFALAKQALGRHYSIIGRVKHGRKIGRNLGYPTINIELNKGGNPLHGVYVVAIEIEGEWYQGVASVGYNPTVGGNTKRLEVYVMNFNTEVYGHFVKVLFYKKLRNEVEFDSLCALRTAIETDVQQTKHFFAEHKGEICEPRL